MPAASLNGLLYRTGTVSWKSWRETKSSWRSEARSLRKQSKMSSRHSGGSGARTEGELTETECIGRERFNGHGNQGRDKEV